MELLRGGCICSPRCCGCHLLSLDYGNKNKHENTDNNYNFFIVRLTTLWRGERRKKVNAEIFSAKSSAFFLLCAGESTSPLVRESEEVVLVVLVVFFVLALKENHDNNENNDND
jgi:hypothetical protein